LFKEDFEDNDNDMTPMIPLLLKKSLEEDMETNKMDGEEDYDNNYHNLDYDNIDNIDNIHHENNDNRNDDTNNNNLSNIKSEKYDDALEQIENYELVKLVQDPDKQGSTIDINNEVTINTINSSDTTYCKEKITAIIFPEAYSHKAYITGNYKGVIKIYDTDTNKYKKYKIHSAEIKCLLHLKGLHSYNNNLASGCKDGTVRISNLNSGKTFHTLLEHTASVNAIIHIIDKFNCFCIVTASSDTNIKLWNLQHQSGYPKCFKTLFNGHTEAVTCLTNINKSLFASGGDDKTIRVWNKFNGEGVRVIGLTNTISCLNSFAKIDYTEFIVNGCNDGTLNIWKKDDKKAYCNLNVSKTRIQNICKIEIKANDEKLIRILTTSLNVIKVWDIENQKVIYEVAETEEITCAAYNEKNGRLYLGFKDGSVIYYNILEKLM